MPGDRALDSGHEHDAAFARVRGERGIHQLSVVKREGQSLETSRAGPVHERRGGVFDEVCRIFAGVKVKVDFEHARSLNGARPI